MLKQSQLLKRLNTCWSGNIRHECGIAWGSSETNLAPSSALWQLDHVPTLQQTSKRCNRPSRSSSTSTNDWRTAEKSDSRKMPRQTGEHSRWAHLWNTNKDGLWTNMMTWTWGEKMAHSWLTNLQRVRRYASIVRSVQTGNPKDTARHIEKRGTHPPPNETYKLALLHKLCRGAWRTQIEHVLCLPRKIDRCSVVRSVVEKL